MSKKSKLQVSINSEKQIPELHSKENLIKRVSSMSLTLLWKYLSQENIDQLEKINVKQAETMFAKIFALNDYQIDLLQASLLDYYFTQYWWARERKFSNEQISLYFSVVYILMDNIKEKDMELNENMTQFIEIFSNELTKIFNETESQIIVDHLNITFFQNYRIYQHALKQAREEIIVSKQIKVECPKLADLPYPPPLAEAMPEKMYKKYVLNLPDDPTAEELAKRALENPAHMIIEEDVASQIKAKFSGISIEDAKKIIFEVTNELVNDLKSEMKVKIKERESALINEVTKGVSSLKAK